MTKEALCLTLPGWSLRSFSFKLKRMFIHVEDIPEIVANNASSLGWSSLEICTSTRIYPCTNKALSLMA